MATLYRKYRPQKFGDLTGQEHIVQTIINEICAGTPAHAYLFSGPRGVGKTTMARLLAKALNCEKRKAGKAEPCDTCSSCAEISAGNNIDVIEIDAASHTGVDNVRENIIDNAQFKPTKSPYKIFIIDEVHMLSTSAFNALLKTLEEPPAHVIFILATTELQKLPATIISRCQRFNFKKIPLDLMVDRLKMIAETEEKKIDAEVLDRVAYKSDGCLRDAESLLGQILSLNLDKITVEDIQNILPAAQLEKALSLLNSVSAGKNADALRQIDELARQGQRLETIANDILEILRIALITNAGGQIKEMDLFTKEQRAGILAIAKQLAASQIIQALDRTLARAEETKSAPLPQLPLEILMVELEQIFNPNNQSDSIIKIDRTKRPETDKTTLKTPPKAKEEPSAIAIVMNEDSTPEIAPLASIAAAQTITLEQANIFWNQMIEQVGGTSPSLTFILKMAEVEKMENNIFNIFLPFNFHREKLEENKTRILIREILTKICGVETNFICQVKTVDESRATPEETAQDLALTFGGEVVA